MAERPSSAAAIAAGVREGALLASDVVESTLEALPGHDAGVDAFLEVYTDRARRRANDIDARRAAGEPLGPLAGVPVALKDNLCLVGEPASCGSRILAGYRAPYSATAVERLEDAGAIVVGRVNMDEFAMGSSCENSAFGPTRNPWSREHVPGGSSGGSAAAVSAGAVPLALGTDTGGSIRQPAAYCGVVGLKPTYGRVSRWGLIAFASSLDQIGPLTTNVEDAALALSVIAGTDERDASCSRTPTDDYLTSLDEGVEGRRVGIIREVALGELDGAVRASWDESLRRLESLGAEVVEVSVPLVGAAIATYYVLANCEASANLARFDGARYGLRKKAGSLHGMYSATRSAGFGAEVKRRIILGTFALSSGYYDAYYGKAAAARRGLGQQLEEAFDQVDLIATPSAPSAAFRIGELVDDPLQMYLSDVFTTPASLAGLPAISLPSGLDAAGLPLGLQLMARPFEEASLLRAAQAFETSVDFAASHRLAEGMPA